MNKRTGVDSSFVIVVIVSFISGLVFGLIIGMKASPNYSENISILMQRDKSSSVL